MVGSSNLAGSGPKVWNSCTAGAGAGWWETSDPLGEGASAAPEAEGGACDMGDDMAEELSEQVLAIIPSPESKRDAVLL
jgi:hypothetical protein